MMEDALSNMQTVATPVGADAADLWLARKLYRSHPDFEDCLVVAAAKRAGADFLITNDKTLVQHSLVPTLIPQDFLAMMADDASPA